MIDYGHSDSWNIRLSHYGSLTGVVADEYRAISAKIDALYGQGRSRSENALGGAEQPVMSPAAYFGGRLRACATPWDTQRRKVSSSVHTLASTTIQPFIGRLVMSNGRVPGSASSMSC